MKRNILIYPFTETCIALINQLDLMTLNLILVSPRGWGLENKCYSIHGENFVTTTEFERNCRECDEIWFVNSSFEINDNLIIPKLKIAKEYGKKIKYFRKKTVAIQEALEIKDTSKQEVPNGLGTIHTPIVLVAGLFRHSGGWESELALLDRKLHNEYKVVHICSEPEGELLGMYTFPDFMIDSYYNESQKIISFNRYIKEIEKIEKPDLFIIGIPGGIKAYSRDIPEDCGILFAMVCSAVPVDSLVLSIPYADYNKTDLNEIKRSIWQKYQVFTDFICLSIKMVMPYDSDNAHKLLYIMLEKERVSKKIGEINDLNLYNIEEEKERIRLQNNLIKKLSEFGEIEFI